MLVNAVDFAPIARVTIIIAVTCFLLVPWTLKQGAVTVWKCGACRQSIAADILRGVEGRLQETSNVLAEDVRSLAMNCNDLATELKVWHLIPFQVV
jgi:hypothetical protein